MTAIGFKITDQFKPCEVASKKADTGDVIFQKSTTFITYLKNAYSPQEIKKMGTERLVRKDAFQLLSPDQQTTVFKALGYKENEIQERREHQAKERLEKIVRVYKCYRTKANKKGCIYSQKDVHQMLKNLHFKDGEITIARKYYMAQREEKVTKYYERYAKQCIKEEEVIKGLKKLKFSDSEIQQAKEKFLGSRPIPQSSVASQQTSSAQPLPSTSRKILQIFVDVFFSICKFLLYAVGVIALALGTMLSLLFGLPLITES